MTSRVYEVERKLMLLTLPSQLRTSTVTGSCADSRAAQCIMRMRIISLLGIRDSLIVSIRVACVMSRILEAAGCRKRLRPQQGASLPSTKVPARNDVVLRLSELNALRFATKNIPDRTPKRWDLVSKFVVDNSDDSSPDVN